MKTFKNWILLGGECSLLLPDKLNFLGSNEGLLEAGGDGVVVESSFPETADWELRCDVGQFNEIVLKFNFYCLKFDFIQFKVLLPSFTYFGIS